MLCGGNMKGDFGAGWLAGRQGCGRYSWLAEGGRLAGWEGCRLMFHPLFVPRYLDYVQTDMGGNLGLSPSCLERLFHFTVCLGRSNALSLSQKDTYRTVLFFFLLSPLSPTL